MKKLTLQVEGIHCASCKALIEDVVKKRNGVEDARVNVLRKTLSLTYDETKTNLDLVAGDVARVGAYRVKLPQTSSTDDGEHDSEDITTMRHVLPMVIASLPFFLMMGWIAGEAWAGLPSLEKFLGHIHFKAFDYEIMFMNVIQFFIATPLLWIGGKNVYKSAFVAARNGVANMDTLVALGTGVSWAYSTVITFVPGLLSSSEGKDGVYFEAAVFIMLFVVIGRFIEDRSKHKAGSAMRALFAMQAQKARVLRNDQEVTISVSQVVEGDILIVKPGEKIPVDGTITQGSSAIDESLMTGESMPVAKNVGDNVIGGAINASGILHYRATAVGERTFLAQIIRMVENAQLTEAPIQRLADRVAGFFVPIVLFISAGTFVFWYLAAPGFGIIEPSQALSLAMYTAITVLVIACPCALGLATPTAILVATGNAARRGLLVKDVHALEMISRPGVMVFDKTGTITSGKPVLHTHSVSQDLLPYLFAIESSSHHPLAHAICEGLRTDKKITDRAKKLTLSSFVDLPGKGIAAKIGDKQIRVGTHAYLRDEGISVDESTDKVLKSMQEDGQTISHVGVDGSYAGFVSVHDPIKHDASEVIKKLKHRGIQTVLLSGDHKRTARAVGKAIGVDEVIAEVLPGEKEAVIARLQQSDTSTGQSIVAMIGDGINDAPALARADVGIAMGTGTDVAQAAGDLIIVGGSLKKIPQLITLSEQTMRIIQQNLFWAFFYNVVGIPIAAGILYLPFGILLSPPLAAVAMAGSSISVVLNSIRAGKSIPQKR